MNNRNDCTESPPHFRYIWKGIIRKPVLLLTAHFFMNHIRKCTYKIAFSVFFYVTFFLNYCL